MSDASTSALASHVTLRRWIGWMGVTLPFVLALLVGAFQSSVSDYYFTNARDYFEGVLFFLALFLFAYRPYGTDGWHDNWITSLAGLFALTLALFPTVNQHLGHMPDKLVLGFIDPKYSGQIHNVGSGGLFVCFAVLSFFFFTLGPKDQRTARKKIRNAIYRVCGLGIGACIGYIGFLAATSGPLGGPDYVAIYIPEATALVLFGLSWLVKGETFPFLNDPA